jgi:poly(A) polymerase
MRFFRFHAAFGEGAPDPVAVAACIAGRDGLDTLSRERVRMELLKLLLARRAPEAAATMAEAGLLTRILGGVAFMPSLARMTQIERGLQIEPDAIRRLGALAVMVTEDADRLFQRLRLSNAEAQQLTAMAEGWWRIEGAMPERGARALLYQLGPAAFLDRTLLAWSRALDATDDGSWSALAQFPQRWSLPKFPVAAADFFAHGIGKGPALGAALRKAEEAWIGADFPLDGTEISEIVRAAANAVQQN